MFKKTQPEAKRSAGVTGSRKFGGCCRYDIDASALVLFLACPFNIVPQEAEVPSEIHMYHLAPTSLTRLPELHPHRFCAGRSIFCRLGVS